MRELLEEWWEDHAAPLGLVLGVLLIAVLFGVFLVPIGPETRVAGVIEGFGVSESELGSYPTATIRLADREITQSLPRSNRCVTGERISLWRQQRVVGQVFAPELNSCASGD